MMKPKGQTEHDTGLLEYLEDIIGTDKCGGQLGRPTAAAAAAAAVAWTNSLHVCSRTLLACDWHRGARQPWFGNAGCLSHPALQVHPAAGGQLQAVSCVDATLHCACVCLALPAMRNELLLQPTAEACAGACSVRPGWRS